MYQQNGSRKEQFKIGRLIISVLRFKIPTHTPAPLMSVAFWFQVHLAEKFHFHTASYWPKTRQKEEKGKLFFPGQNLSVYIWTNILLVTFLVVPHEFPLNTK